MPIPINYRLLGPRQPYRTDYACPVQRTLINARDGTLPFLVYLFRSVIRWLRLRAEQRRENFEDAGLSEKSFRIYVVEQDASDRVCLTLRTFV